MFICLPRSSGENVGSSALMLNVGIRLTLNNLLNVESCFAKVACDLVGTIKEEVNAHSLAPSDFDPLVSR
jgi:hypothetical protein